MKIEVRNSCDPFDDYRSNRCRSMFNTTVDQGRHFERDFDLPFEKRPWSVGVVVGPSGTGKSSVGRQIFGEPYLIQRCYWQDVDATGEPFAVIDQISPWTGADPLIIAETLERAAAIGLPASALAKPYGQLSNGEQFRADLVRVLVEHPEQIVIDEFTSVVDRRIAERGARAFQEIWRKDEALRATGPLGSRAVLLTCHHDVVSWLEPDWVFDTNTGRFGWTADLSPEEVAVMGRAVGPRGVDLGEIVA